MSAAAAGVMVSLLDRLDDQQRSIAEARRVAEEAAARGEKEPLQGERGPAPAHRWKGTALQFQQPDGKWGPLVDLLGPSSRGGRGIGVESAQINDSGELVFTLTDGKQINAGSVMAADQYTEAEYLPDQPSAGAVLVFTFSAPVRQAWIELLADSVEDVSTGRARVDGADPQAEVGTPLVAGRPQPVRGEIDQVRVLAGAGKRVAVYGYR